MEEKIGGGEADKGDMVEAREMQWGSKVIEWERDILILQLQSEQLRYQFNFQVFHLQAVNLVKNCIWIKKDKNQDDTTRGWELDKKVE